MSLSVLDQILKSRFNNLKISEMQTQQQSVDTSEILTRLGIIKPKDGIDISKVISDLKQKISNAVAEPASNTSLGQDDVTDGPIPAPPRSLFNGQLIF